jgi:hypothetical protein
MPVLVEHGGAGRYGGDGLSDAGEDDTVLLPVTGDGGGDVAPRGGGNDFDDVEEEHAFDANGGDDDVDKAACRTAPPVGGLFFVWTSIIDNLKEVLSDPLLQEKCGGEMLLRAANLEGDEEIISEMNQGEWWRRTEQEYCRDDAQVCLVVLPIICFTDKA